jgi:hypothetical protein
VSKTSNSRRRVYPAILGALGLAMAAEGAAAHHSSAMFDRSKTYVLTGTLIKYQFMAPHSWISVMAKVNGKGKAARWDLEGSSAGRMRAQGITPERLKPGDKITVRTHPLRDGRNGGDLIDIVLADGTKISNNVTRLQIGQ